MAAVPEARTASMSQCTSPRPSPANAIEVYVEGIAVLALVDTGAAVSVISAKLCRILRKVMTPLSDLSLRTANAQNITPLAACTARVFIQGLLYTVEFVVLPSCSHDIILGWDFLANNNAIIDCCHAELELSALHDFETIDDRPSSHKLLVSEDNAVPPCSSLLVPVSCAAISDGTVLFTPSEVFIRRKCSPLPFALLTLRSGATKMLVDNPTACPLPLFHGECLGLVHPVDTFCIFDAPAASTPTDLSSLACDLAVDQSLLDAFHRSIDDETSSSERSQLLTLLQKFRASFDSPASGLGRTSTVFHQIDTGSHAPLRQRPYRVSASERRVIDDQVDDMLKRGVVQPSNSPWASPVVLVKKRMALFGSASTTDV